jgi:ribosomal protein L11 methylase PrmA
MPAARSSAAHVLRVHYVAVVVAGLIVIAVDAFHVRGVAFVVPHRDCDNNDNNNRRRRRHQQHSWFRRCKDSLPEHPLRSATASGFDEQQQQQQQHEERNDNARTVVVVAATGREEDDGCAATSSRHDGQEVDLLPDGGGGRDGSSPSTTRGNEEDEDRNDGVAMTKDDDVAGLRSLTFSNLPRDQEPQLLCNLLMELGATSTSIVDAERGTDREVAIFGEPNCYRRLGGADASAAAAAATNNNTAAAEGASTTTEHNNSNNNAVGWNLCHVSAHFSDSASIEWIMEIVRETFPNMPPYSSVTKVEDKDWVLHVQQSWKPIVVPPFVLRFPWHTDDAVAEALRGGRHHHNVDSQHDEAAAGVAPVEDGTQTTTSTTAAGREMVELHLQGGVAFGTGEHPTTQLCLEFVSEAVARRRGNVVRVMDYGAGSGVLGMAACKLDPAVSAVGVDIDVDAVRIANANAGRNGVHMKTYLSDLFTTENDDESTSVQLRKTYSGGKQGGDTARVLPEELSGPIGSAGPHTSGTSPSWGCIRT